MAGRIALLKLASLCSSTMMTIVFPLPPLQPPGGFPSIRIERRLPNTGPTGAAIFGIAAAIMGYGFYQLYGAKKDKR